MNLIYFFSVLPERALMVGSRWLGHPAPGNLHLSYLHFHFPSLTLPIFLFVHDLFPSFALPCLRA